MTKDITSTDYRPTTTNISVRLDKDLVAWLEHAAVAENRTRSNLIETMLKQLKATKEAK